MCIGRRVNCPLFVSDVNKTTVFSTDSTHTVKYQNFMKIFLVEAESFHADTRTDRHDAANSRFS